MKRQLNVTGSRWEEVWTVGKAVLCFDVCTFEMDLSQYTVQGNSGTWANHKYYSLNGETFASKENSQLELKSQL